MPRTARDVVFVDGVRTPFGKAGPNGLYAETRADDMVVSVIRELLRRNPALPRERIGDVAIVGVPGEFFTALGEEIKRRSPSAGATRPSKRPRILRSPLYVAASRRTNRTRSTVAPSMLYTPR